jgi:hypothetical protein
VFLVENLMLRPRVGRKREERPSDPHVAHTCSYVLLLSQTMTLHHQKAVLVPGRAQHA